MTIDSYPKPDDADEPIAVARPDLVRIGPAARALGISTSWMRYLADHDIVPSVRSEGGHRYFDLAAVREAWERNTVQLPRAAREHKELRFTSRYELTGLMEHLVWEQAQSKLELEAGSSAYGVMHYAMTEMVNNAIDHSGGTAVRVTVRGDGDDLEVVVEDDGTGVFAHMSEHLGLPGFEAALLELSKGRRTTAPDRHTGEGIFFTSKAVALFELQANGIVWIVDNRRDEQAVGESQVVRGTRVRFVVSTTDSVDLSELFRRYTNDDFKFSRTRPSVKLAEIGTEFVSRSEAKRLLTGLEQFDEIEVDFADVTRVGQGFADEVFRVWPALHPGKRVVPVNMVPMVEFMVRRASQVSSAAGEHPLRRNHRPD